MGLVWVGMGWVGLGRVGLGWVWLVGGIVVGWFLSLLLLVCFVSVCLGWVGFVCLLVGWCYCWFVCLFVGLVWFVCLFAWFGLVWLGGLVGLSWVGWGWVGLVGWLVGFLVSCLVSWLAVAVVRSRPRREVRRQWSLARFGVKMELPLGKNNMFERKGCSRSSLARFLHFDAIACALAGAS